MRDPSLTLADSGRQVDATSSASQRGDDQKFRPDIQGLRALAVLLVIANHAGLPGFSGGYIGVDMFFVVSGFVITGLLLRNADMGLGRGLADFYCRRIRRIAPAASVTLIGTLVIAASVLGPRVGSQLPDDVRWASLFAANFRLIAVGSNYFVPGVHSSLVTQFWSLAVEEQFYLLYPLVVFLVVRVAGPARRPQLLAGALVPMIVLSAWWSAHISSSEPVTAYYSPFTRFWELGLGCLLAVGMTMRPARTVTLERIAVGLALLFIAAALSTLNSTSVYPGTSAWLPCAATVLLIWAGAGGGRTPVIKLLSIRPLGYVGDISFSLYLTHYVWLELPRQLLPPATGWGWLLLELGATAVSSVCLHHLVENPIRQSARFSADRLSVVLLLGVCIAASWMTADVVSRFLPIA